jgi:non-ribosomal peptide synthase protein (TIGR01720 family)
MESDKMRAAVAAVITHHDALRMRYIQIDAHNWTQYNSDVSEVVPFSSVDLSAIPDSECEHIINAEFERLHRSLDLEHGPLLQVCWFNPGPHRAGRLLVVVHHIVMDIVSWAALLEDIMIVYRQLDGSKDVHLPIKTNSFKQWAQALNEYAHSQVLSEEIPHWLDIAKRPPQPLPVDFADSDHSLATTQSVFTEMTPDQTHRLQTVVAPHFQTQFSQILLAALAIALHRFSGNTQLQIKVEGQGREDIGIELNLSRTLGWFTSFYPMSITVNPDHELKQQLNAAIHRIEAIPNRGIGYSVLRYLSRDEEIKAQIDTIPESEITFNFTGQSGSLDRNESRLSKEDTAFWGQLAETGKIQLAESKQGRRRHLIEVGAGVVDERLVVRFAYGEKRFDQRSIQRLGHALICTLEDMIQIPDI